MSIAIIGGGVGGLAVAWNIHETFKAAGLAIPPIQVVEKNERFGGNADTRHFDFGKGPGYEDKPLRRWADMGVNDFNIPAYKNIVRVMEQIGYVKGKDYRNLEDSTTYYTTTGHAMTANSQPNGDADPWWGTAMPPELRASVDSFMMIAGKDGSDPKFHDYTMEQYITEQTPAHKWDPRLGPEVIYPRVNGMYFTSGPLGPRKMPFAAVMHYYSIQEGAGGEKADRNYFVGGASTWIDSLVDYMKTNMPEIVFTPGFAAECSRDAASGMWKVADANSTASFFADIVVLATPADIALRVMKSGLPAEAANIMAQIKYETAVSVAHTDARLMPVNRNAWSTYNIVIHEPGSVALKPYVINYVANRHQNDVESPEFNKFGLPQFFVSVNPHVPVPEDMVLKDINGEPAKADLKHFVFDFDCMQAQTDMVAQQGRENVYYASGWTHGSGLHTECWTQGADVAGMIRDHMLKGSHVQADAAKVADLVPQRLAASIAGGRSSADYGA